MRSVLVTGATGSVGQSLVRAYSSAGFQVRFQFHSRSDIATALEKETDSQGIACDMRTQQLERTMLDAAQNCDVLVNNAATNNCREEAANVSIEDWQETLLVNLTAPFLLSQSALKGMTSRKWGRIINISSIYGLRGSEHNLPYTVSKHGLSGLTKTIAREYADRGITCNEICPGPIDSELLKRIGDHYFEHGGKPTSEFYQSLAAEIPSRRLATPNDVTACAVFLASDAAAYINGVSIPVDGGLIA